MEDKMIDVRSIASNLVSTYYGKYDLDMIRKTVEDIYSHASFDKIDIADVALILKGKIIKAKTATEMQFFADSLAYIEYMSGMASNRILDSIKKTPIAMCEKRCSDRCSMYCDGFNTDCDMYCPS